MKQLGPIVLLLIFSLWGMTLPAQTRLVARGDKAFAQKQYATAAGYYTRAIESGEVVHDAYLVSKKAGDSYYALRHYEQAALCYEKYLAALPNPDSAVLHKTAGLMLNQGKITEAKQIMYDLLRQNPGDKNLEHLIACCDFASEQLARPTGKKAVSLDLVNSPQSDFAPAFRNRDLIFASRRMNADYSVIADRGILGYSDYYMAGYNEKKQVLRKPERLKGNINGDFDDGSLTWCPSTQTAWLTKCDGDPGSCAIYSANLKKKRWTNLKPVQIGDAKYNYAHPSVTPDGDKLYFSSDLPGGYGGKDIWWVPLSSAGEKLNPVNAGALVNTAKDEIYPFILGDSLLFFASGGHTGMGGIDIFYSRITDGVFEKPVNPGSPVNSTADDFGLTAGPDRQTWYFSSNRDQARNDDIFYISGVITTKRAAPGRISVPAPVVAAKEPVKVPAVIEPPAAGAAKKETTEAPVRDVQNITGQITDPSLTPGKYYRVQIIAGSRLINPAVEFRKIDDLINQFGLSVDKVGGLYKYRVGNFETRTEAQTLQAELKRRGYNDCFILEF